MCVCCQWVNYKQANEQTNICSIKAVPNNCFTRYLLCVGQVMEKFKRSFSIRKKRDTSSESSKPHQWQEDERKVREGSCSFQVKVNS